MSGIKILVSYYQEHPLIQTDIILPIQTGCAKATKLYEGMLRDNDGENISDKNIQYNELSAQYWAWKNMDKLDNPDYIGFMHYRRHFMFDGWTGNPDFVWLPQGSVYLVPPITNEYLGHLDSTLIRKQISDCDCIVIKRYDVNHLGHKNLRENYSRLPEQHGEFFDIMIATAKRVAPDYIREIEMLEKGHEMYLCNMFIMNRALFDRYNSFCFSILKEVDKQIDSSQMSEAGARFLGYFGEFLLSAFIFKLYHEGKTRIKELPASFILDDGSCRWARFKYLKYKLLYLISFGRRHQKYRRKYKKYKAILKEQKIRKRLA